MTIDSNGKPGIGGTASGIEASVELDDGDAVRVVEGVVVSPEVPELNVLTRVVCCMTAVVELGEVDVVLLVLIVVVV